MIGIWLGMNVMMRNMYIMECYVCMALFMDCRWWVWCENWHVN